MRAPMRKHAGQGRAAARHGRGRAREATKTKKAVRAVGMLVAVLVATLVFGAGCADKRLDLRNIEAAMKHRYEREIRVPIVEVTCPEMVRTRAGETFDCLVTFEGGASWTITAAQLEGGKTRWTPQGRAIPGEDLEARAAAVLAGQGRRSEIHCGERVYVAREGDRIACQAVTGSGAARIEISVGAGDAVRVHEAAAPVRSPEADAGALGGDAG